MDKSGNLHTLDVRDPFYELVVTRKLWTDFHDRGGVLPPGFEPDPDTFNLIAKRTINLEGHQLVASSYINQNSIRYGRCRVFLLREHKDQSSVFGEKHLKLVSLGDDVSVDELDQPLTLMSRLSKVEDEITYGTFLYAEKMMICALRETVLKQIEFPHGDPIVQIAVPLDNLCMVMVTEGGIVCIFDMHLQKILGKIRKINARQIQFADIATNILSGTNSVGFDKQLMDRLFKTVDQKICANDEYLRLLCVLDKDGMVHAVYISKKTNQPVMTAKIAKKSNLHRLCMFVCKDHMHTGHRDIAVDTDACDTSEDNYAIRFATKKTFSSLEKLGIVLPEKTIDITSIVPYGSYRMVYGSLQGIVFDGAANIICVHSSRILTMSVTKDGIILSVSSSRLTVSKPCDETFSNVGIYMDGLEVAAIHESVLVASQGQQVLMYKVNLEKSESDEGTVLANLEADVSAIQFYNSGQIVLVGLKDGSIREIDLLMK